MNILLLTFLLQAAPPPGHVALPIAEYNRLMEQAALAAKQPGAPPQGYALHSGEYKLRVEKDLVAGTLTLQGEVLRKGAVPITLAAGLTILDAQQNGRPLPLRQEKGVPAAMLEGPGEFTIQLECGLPYTTEPGRAVLTIPPLAAGAVRLNLSIPGEQTAANLIPGLLTARSSAAGRTNVEAALAPGKSTTVFWNARIATPTPTVAPKDLRFLSDVKTLVSVTEAEIAVTTIADITLLQGQSDSFDLALPAGYEVTSVNGATLASSENGPSALTLRVTNANLRSHQFLVSMAKANSGAAAADVPLPGFNNAQRETGEVLVESQGALDLAAKESGGLRRMDLREASPPLRSLAGHAVQAAFRYQKRATETPGVSLAWIRFPASPALPALADKAVVTTLVTREGRALTEVRLTVRNTSQAFVRVALPAGASILTADVAGERVKPVDAPDGSRVPLLRAGFRPTGPYGVSFVFSHAGAAFAKRGASQITLPRFDLPSAAMEWEVFLPSEFRVADFGGDVLPADLLPRSGGEAEPVFALEGSLSGATIGGTVVDPTGATVPGARIVVELMENGQRREAVSDGNGQWRVPTLSAGRVVISVERQGFKSSRQQLDHRPDRPLQVTTTLEVGSVSQSVEISGSQRTSAAREPQQIRREADNQASANVTDLQRRLAGVLPITVTVPRTGNAYRFVRPLVLDEETRLTFSYRSGK